MKVDKLITTTEKIDLDITGSTLISIEEYKQARGYISRIDSTWWLRSPGVFGNDAAFVFGDDGNVSDNGTYVTSAFGVRPALKISNLKSSNFQVGDKFKFADYLFTVISDNYALCDSAIGKSAFREDWKADDANDYGASDVKKYIDTWFNKAKRRRVQIVIDIDDEDYKRIQDIPDVFNSLTSRTYLAIRNGTPLPKGHGNLIQREEAEAIFRNAKMALYKQSHTEQIKDFQTRELMLLNAEQFVHLIKPIIEAESEEV